MSIVPLKWRIRIRVAFLRRGFRNPFMLVKTHETEVGKLVVTQSEYVKRLKDDHRREIAFLKKDLIEFFDKAAKVNIEVDRANNNNRFRLMFELDERWIRDSFQWGNDQKFIGYFSEYIAEAAKREIFRINVRR